MSSSLSKKLFDRLCAARRDSGGRRTCLRVNMVQDIHNLRHAALLAGAQDTGAPLLDLGGAVGGGEGDGGDGQHGDVVLVVPHALDVLGVDAQAAG